MFSQYGTPKADFQTAQEQSQQLSQHLEAFLTPLGYVAKTMRKRS
jgi:hypothetical protein